MLFLRFFKAKKNDVFRVPFYKQLCKPFDLTFIRKWRLDMKPAKNAAYVCIVLPISLKTIILYRFLLGRKSETYIIQKCAWYWKQLDRMGGVS